MSAYRFLLCAVLRAAAVLTRTELSIDGAGTLREATSVCAPLQNHGTHSTVQIAVGTPGQKFDVVADTGSDAVIVASCLCQASGNCAQDSKCFVGTDRSSTFSMMEADKVPMLQLSFGSGQIEAAVVTDIVAVGDIKTTMNQDLLLMVDKALDFDGPFEGILGLGLPTSKNSLMRSEATSSKKSMAILGFLETAGVKFFSLCFNEGADGFLRLGVPAASVSLGSVGKVHWALNFEGVQIGNASVDDVGICRPSSANPGSPCAAIPDSGTTAVMAPEAHITKLLATVCDQWPRCATLAAAVAETQGLDPKPTQEELHIWAFMRLLSGCSEWLSEGSLDEMPTLSFHVAGSEGTKQILNLPPSSYILQTSADQYPETQRALGLAATSVHANVSEMCAPAFGVMDFSMSAGPIWIFGTSFFYEYQVGYDMSSTPPSIAFSEEPCACDQASASFVTEKANVRTRRSAMPRQISGRPRVPSFDTNSPL